MRGVCILNCQYQVARQEGAFMGEVALPNLSHSCLSVSLIPKTKGGVVGCAEGARLRSQGEGWKYPAEQVQ